MYLEIAHAGSVHHFGRRWKALYKRISDEAPTEREAWIVDSRKQFVEIVLSSAPFAQLYEADGRVEELGPEILAFPPYGAPRRGAFWEVGKQR